MCIFLHTREKKKYFLGGLPRPPRHPWDVAVAAARIFLDVVCENFSEFSHAGFVPRSIEAELRLIDDDMSMFELRNVSCS
jgi:hypothetical protein